MATFAPQPSEFEYPYWDTRVAYDASLEAAINANETAAGSAQTRADNAFTNAATAQATADAALPVHLPPATGANLNTLTAVGVHPVPWLTGTLALNFPIASTAGIVEVLPYDGVKLIQRFSPTTGTVATRGTWTRRRADTSTWGAWTFQPVQRIDNSAGRAIYTWDDTQNREQLVYGDTGWRVLTSWNAAGEVTGQPLPAGVAPYDGVAGFIRIRREGYSVRYGLAGYKITANSPAFLLPSGFLGGVPKVAYLPSTSAPSGMLLRTAKIGTAQIYTSLSLGDTNADPSYATELEWSTNAPWPTTLPGTASGTIPHN